MLIKMIHSSPGGPPLGDHEVPDELGRQLVEAGKALEISADEAELHNLGLAGRRVRGDG